VIDAARRAGLKTAIMFGPLLPFLSDSQPTIDALLKQAAELRVDSIWVDALNPRPRVWPAVVELLRAEFPELLPQYRKILFSEKSRSEYLAELRARIAIAAERAALSDRVAACM
jgi:DNA repair photolyase